MKIGLVGGSNQERSLPFDAQRTVNLFPVMDQQGKDVAALYGTPGLTLLGTAGVGPNRDHFAASNGRAFAVSNTGLYEVFSTGSVILRGSLDSATGNVTMDENGLQLAVCDGVNVYIFTYSSNAFVKVSDPDLPSAGTLTFIDGYFAINKNSSGQFNISSLYDGTAWAALDFATAESSPDNLLRVINAVGQLWLFGSKTTEIWTNTGASAFPFERISGAKMEMGIIAPHSAVPVDNSIFWIGRNDIGAGIVYRAQGFTPQRISTNTIELLLQKAPSPQDIKGYTYQQDGHTFYVITGGGLSTTLVYDISTQAWHERAYLNGFGAFEQHLGYCGMYAFNRQLVGNRQNGKIYTMALDVYTDDGAPLKAQRTFTHLIEEGARFKARELQVDFEYGPELIADPGKIALGNNPLETFASEFLGSPITTTAGSNIIVVNDTSAVQDSVVYIGDPVTFSGITSVGGISAAVLNAQHAIYNIDTANHKYTVALSVNASSSATGGGPSAFADYGWVLVSAPAHGLATGDQVEITGATAVGGMTAAQINGVHFVIRYSANQFIIRTAGLDANFITGGGASVTYRKILARTQAVATLEISRDGGRTWSNEYQVGLGKVGQYVRRAIWRRLGIASMWTFRVSITDPVKRAICGAYLR